MPEEENKLVLPFRIYEGDSLLTVPEDTSKPLIEDFLFHDDFIMLLAEDKMGKTILSTQMACSLSSGTPFLGIFDIPEPVNTWLFAHEGKDAQLIDRLVRMNNAVPIDTSRFKLFCGAKFRWNDKECYQYINYILDLYKDELPKVIFIDPLYAGLKGDLKDNDMIKEFIYILRCTAEICKAAIVVVHHMKKNQRDNKGKYASRNDTDAFGSAVLKWAVDHVFWLDQFHIKEGMENAENKNDKFLKCDTQRGGNISANIRLRLMEPDPLYFVSVDKYVDKKDKIMVLLKTYKNGLNVEQLIKKSKLGRSALYIILKQLVDEEKVEKYGTKVKFFKIT